MNKKLKYCALITLGIAMVGCTSQNSQQEKSKGKETISYSAGNKEQDSSELSGNNGMEISETDAVTVETLIERLKKDKIVQGEPKKIEGAVAGDSSVTQVGTAVIVEYAPNKVDDYLKAEETKKISFQGKEYDVVSQNGQFMLLLLNGGDKEKANESFSENPNEDRSIIF